MKALAAAAHTPSSKQKHLTSIQKHYADPVNRRKASDVSKAYYDEHPEMKQQISDFQKSFWTPERRQQQRERLLAYHKHHKELHHKTD